MQCAWSYLDSEPGPVSIAPPPLPFLLISLSSFSFSLSFHLISFLPLDHGHEGMGTCGCSWLWPGLLPSWTHGPGTKAISIDIPIYSIVWVLVREMSRAWMGQKHGQTSPARRHAMENEGNARARRENI